MNNKKLSPGYRLKHARQMTGLSRDKFMKATNISANSLRAWETNINPIRPKVAYSLALKLESLGIICAPEWILDGTGDAPRLKKNLNETKASSISLSVQREISAFKLGNKNSIVKIIPDNSMLPFFHKNDYVGGHDFTSPISVQSFSNELCIIEINDGEILIRKVIYDKKNNNTGLIATNLASELENTYLSDEKIKKISKIIWHRKI